MNTQAAMSLCTPLQNAGHAEMVRDGHVAMALAAWAPLSSIQPYFCRPGQLSICWRNVPGRHRAKFAVPLHPTKDEVHHQSVASKHIESDRGDLLRHTEGSVVARARHQDRLDELAVVATVSSARRSTRRAGGAAVHQQLPRLQNTSGAMDTCASPLLNSDEKETYEFCAAPCEDAEPFP